MALADINAFRDWLRKQVGRKDVVGRFAVHFCADYFMRNAPTISTIDRLIQENWGDDWEGDGWKERMCARDLAWREWKGYTSGPQRTIDGRYWTFDGSVWRKSRHETAQQCANDLLSLVAIISAAHKAGYRGLEREMRCQLEERHNIKLTFVRTQESKKQVS